MQGRARSWECTRLTYLASSCVRFPFCCSLLQVTPLDTTYTSFDSMEEVENAGYFWDTGKSTINSYTVSGGAVVITYAGSECGRGTTQSRAVCIRQDKLHCFGGLNGLSHGAMCLRSLFLTHSCNLTPPSSLLAPSSSCASLFLSFSLQTPSAPQLEALRPTCCAACPKAAAWRWMWTAA